MKVFVVAVLGVGIAVGSAGQALADDYSPEVSKNIKATRIRHCGSVVGDHGTSHLGLGRLPAIGDGQQSSRPRIELPAIESTANERVGPGGPVLA